MPDITADTADIDD
jgi:hypothetical protein